jgi:hypothetical protein
MDLRIRIKGMVKDFGGDVLIAPGSVIGFVVEIETSFKGTNFREGLSAA